MVRRGDFKLNYYRGEPLELFDVVNDPGEFTNLADDPRCAAIRDELLALVLRDWNPDRIDQTARESQRLRRIVIEGSPHLSFEHWAARRRQLAAEGLGRRSRHRLTLGARNVSGVAEAADADDGGISLDS